jgi:hypothetical protein
MGGDRPRADSARVCRPTGDRYLRGGLPTWSFSTFRCDKWRANYRSTLSSFSVLPAWVRRNSVSSARYLSTKLPSIHRIHGFNNRSTRTGDHFIYALGLDQPSGIEGNAALELLTPAAAIDRSLAIRPPSQSGRRILKRATKSAR